MMKLEEQQLMLGGMHRHMHTWDYLQHLKNRAQYKKQGVWRSEEWENYQQRSMKETELTLLKTTQQLQSMKWSTCFHPHLNNRPVLEGLTQEMSTAAVLKARTIQCEIGFLLYASLIVCSKLRVLSRNETGGFGDPSSIISSYNDQGSWEIWSKQLN